MPKDVNSGEIDACHVLAGGDPFSPKEVAAPGVLTAAGAGALPTSIAGRRRALAEWIVSPENPLPARVMANRVWQWTFGTPLAGNPNNFGATGKKPTHPEMLDWLAADFIQKGWSVKKLQRTLILSETYRRSARHADPALLAAKDPSGTSYAAFQPRRLSAEEARDAMLAVSNELNRKIGGIPARPEIHPDVAFQPRQVMGTYAPAYEPSPRPEQRHRRTLYALKQRGVRDPFLDVFNSPSPDLSCEARDVSTVAPQAFALLNSAASRARALAFADRLLKETSSREQAIDLAFALSFNRQPSEDERAACLAHWTAMTARHEKIVFEKPAKIVSITRHVIEENTGEAYSYVEKLPMLAEFQPDLHPADVPASTRGLMEVCLSLLNANEFLYLD
jgi:hypothetical protein